MQDESAAKQTKRLGRREWVIFGILAVVVIGLWGGAWYLLVNNQWVTTWTDRAGFGDMFGALGTLFSGLAFAGLIFAIRLQSHELTLQRQELSLTRDELSLTRDELKRTADSQEQTERVLSRQREIMAMSALLNASMLRLTSPETTIEPESEQYQQITRKITTLEQRLADLIFDV